MVIEEHLHNVIQGENENNKKQSIQVWLWNANVTTE